MDSSPEIKIAILEERIRGNDLRYRERLEWQKDALKTALEAVEKAAGQKNWQVGVTVGVIVGAAEIIVRFLGK